MKSGKVRLGLLGAARIAPMSIIRPARELAGRVVVAAVACRDPDRARRFAARHGIARMHSSYEELLRDEEVDAVYNALPNSLHGYWTARALEARKNVLCEKPLALNTAETQSLAELAARTGLVLSEGVHYRHHPLAGRIREILDSGNLGPVEHIDACVTFPVLLKRNIRYSYALGGGATMDQGCYAVSLIRFLGGGEPQVVKAEASLASAGVDQRMTADLDFPTGATAHMKCSIAPRDLFHCNVRVRARNGYLRIVNPVAPHLFHSLEWSADGIRRRERLRGFRSSYYYQLESFCGAVEDGRAVVTNAQEGVRNQRVIDEIYRSAGLPLRGLEQQEQQRGRR